MRYETDFQREIRCDDERREQNLRDKAARLDAPDFDPPGPNMMFYLPAFRFAELFLFVPPEELDKVFNTNDEAQLLVWKRQLTWLIGLYREQTGVYQNRLANIVHNYYDWPISGMETWKDIPVPKDWELRSLGKWDEFNAMREIELNYQSHSREQRAEILIGAFLEEIIITVFEYLVFHHTGKHIGYRNYIQTLEDHQWMLDYVSQSAKNKQG